MAQAGVIRVDKAYLQTVRQLAKRRGESMQAVVERAIDAERRNQMFADADAFYTTLQSDQEAWAEEIAERELWADTLGDGLDSEIWTEDGRVASRA